MENVELEEFAVARLPPLPAPPNRQLIFSVPHFREWYRLERKSSKLAGPGWKFMWSFLLSLFEVVSLIYTLFGGDLIEGSVAIVLHIFCCLLTAYINYANQAYRTSRRQSFKRAILRFLINATVFLKPLRLLRLFYFRQTRLRITMRSDVITKAKVQALTELKAVELEEERMGLYETFFQNLPMTILQIWFLLQTHEKFQLCSLHSLAQVGVMTSAVVQGAKSVALYETAKHDYEQALHFLAYFKTEGRLPMVLYTSAMLQIFAFFNFLCQCSTMAQRLYTAFCFMVVSVYLSLIYFVLFFVVNSVALYLFPQHLLEPHQNAPLGISTFSSYLAERLINIFCNVGTRFNKFTNKPKLFGCRLPLVLVQFILHTLVVVAVIPLSSLLLKEQNVPASESILPTRLNDTLTDCPELESVYSLHPIFTKIGDIFFPAYKSLDERLQTFNDIFKMIYFHWLVMYLQIPITWVYAFADLKTRTVRRTEENGEVATEVTSNIFPVLTAYLFYESLLHEITFISKDIVSIRKLMVLTVMKEAEFYRAVRYLGSVSSKSPFSESTNRFCQHMIKVLNRRQVVADDEVDERIDSLMNMELGFRNEFRVMKSVITWNTMADRKLFYGFVRKFDNKMVYMTSDRIERIFDIMGVSIQNVENAWGEVITSNEQRSCWEILFQY